ncbi:hypothetical protein ACFWAR_25670 [Streptomyces sp. NPDC059917]|uniref:hypothetical protein n=1 Tax=Streptomyces sp. NPDC059917 TaxID=3347002 RepID=UPI003649DE8C
METGLLRRSVWLLAMGAAVAVSWWGIRSVMHGAVDDPPQALLITAGAASPPAPPPKAAPGTTPPPRTPTPSPPASTGTGGQNPDGHSGGPATPPGTNDPGSGPSRSTGNTPSPSRSTPRGETRSRVTEGGTVTFSVGKDSASLLTAAPAPGWSVQRWVQDKWIRVTFTRGSASVSVFCVWHDQAPTITTDPA